MSDLEKKQMILQEIKTMYPNKIILNGSQTGKVLGISMRTFTRFISNKEFHKLPKFKSERIIRKDDMKNNKYQFNIFDIAEFLAKN